jgi:hypothetical protein
MFHSKPEIISPRLKGRVGVVGMGHANICDETNSSVLY